MNIMNSRKAAVAITAAVVVVSTLLGSHRSLAAPRNAALAVFEKGAYGDGAGVKSDLLHRRDVCRNLCTVAGRYLPGEDAGVAEVETALAETEGAAGSPAAHARLLRAARDLMDRLAGEALTEKDRGYLSDFAAELTSTEATIAHDPYTQLARQFNGETLGGPLARVLGGLTGVRALPIYE